jgi:hypothetical protein
MTKSRETGQNEVTDEAKREAARKKINVSDVLAEWLKEAISTNDTERIRKIIKAQKYLGCRNIRKRRDTR